MARSTLEVKLQARVVKVTAEVDLVADDGTVVGTTEVDLTPKTKRSFGGQVVAVSDTSDFQRDVSNAAMQFFGRHGA